MKIYDFCTSSGKDVIEDYFEKQSQKVQLEYSEIREAIREYGFKAFKEFLSTRQLRGKLWEIKFSNERIAYVFLNEDSVLFVHAFKKQKSKTEKSDIKLAEKRVKEMKKRM